MERMLPKIRNAEECNKEIALKIRNIRKRRGLTQQMLSDLSGVSIGSIKRFESTGKISLNSFTRIVISLGEEQNLLLLFENARNLRGCKGNIL